MGISEEDVDGEIIKSCSHGLDADFIKLFDMCYKGIESRLQHGTDLFLPEDVQIPLNNGKIVSLNYIDGVPIFSIR